VELKQVLLVGHQRHFEPPTHAEQFRNVGHVSLMSGDGEGLADGVWEGDTEGVGEADGVWDGVGGADGVVEGLAVGSSGHMSPHNQYGFAHTPPWAGSGPVLLPGRQKLELAHQPQPFCAVQFSHVVASQTSKL